MSCNLHLLRRIKKTDEMGQSFLFFLLFNLIIVSSTSTGYHSMQNDQSSLIRNNNPMRYHEPVGTGPVSEDQEFYNNRMRGAGYYYYQQQQQRPALTTSSTTLRPTANSSPVRWDPYVSDTCGGSVNIPLSFNRLLPYKSTHFPSRRDYPIICNWNFTVIHGNCRRALVTMRLDGRSRLPDVDGCRKGYYRVSPIMKGARICGRIGNVPAFQWYVDAHPTGSDVTVITMKNMGINDGYYEGLSFTLQGECVNDELYDPRRIDVEKENARLNRRWMNRVFEDYLVEEGPRIIVKPTPRSKIPITTTSPPTTSSHPATTTTTTTAKTVVSYDNSGIPWLILKSPNVPSSSEFREKSAKVKNGTIVNQEIQLENPITTTDIPSTTTEESTTIETQSTDQFPLTTISTLFVTETTTNDVISTEPSTVDPSTTPSSPLVMMETTLKQSSLSDVASTTTERPSTATTTTPGSVDEEPNNNISGPKLVFILLQQTFQRTFLKFLKLFN